MNIKFSYLYRDGANYKNFHHVVFSNPKNLSVEKIDEVIRKNLIDGQWFIANKWDLPNMHFREYAWDSDIDHDWHEFDGIEETSDPVTDINSIEQFLLCVEK